MPRHPLRRDRPRPLTRLSTTHPIAFTIKPNTTMKTSQARLILLFLASLLLTVAGTSCNTVRGVGRDVEHAGDHIENATR